MPSSCVPLVASRPSRRTCSPRSTGGALPSSLPRPDRGGQGTAATPNVPRTPPAHPAGCVNALNDGRRSTLPLSTSPLASMRLLSRIPRGQPEHLQGDSATTPARSWAPVSTSAARAGRSCYHPPNTPRAPRTPGRTTWSRSRPRPGCWNCWPGGQPPAPGATVRDAATIEEIEAEEISSPGWSPAGRGSSPTGGTSRCSAPTGWKRRPGGRR
jgi:hypothetical protein